MNSPALRSGMSRLAVTCALLGVAFVAVLTLSCDHGTQPALACPDPIQGYGMTLLTPNGCDAYRVDDTMVITWERDSGASAVEIHFSSDNGLNYTGIGTIYPGDPAYAGGPFLWAIPDSARGAATVTTTSDSCVIRIRDYFETRFFDVSDGAFTVRG